MTLPTIRTAARWRRMSKLSRGLFLLCILFVLATLLRVLGANWNGILFAIQFISGAALLLLGVPWLWNFVHSRMLWSLRNKLAITYLLFGLAPIILFVTLVLVSAYVAAGQFAIHLVALRLQTKLEHLQTENNDAAGHLARIISRSRSDDPTVTAGDSLDNNLLLLDDSEVGPRQIAAFVDRQPILVATRSGVVRSPLDLPDWSPSSEGFSGIVYDDRKLYLAAITRRKTSNNHIITVLRSIPLDRALMDQVAAGLGRAALVPALAAPGSQTPSSSLSNELALATRRGRMQTQTVAGGSLPAAVNMADLHVHFFSTIPMTDWETATKDNVPVEVDSRPSLLYNQLFAASLEGLVPGIIRVGLILLCVFFALIEIFALYMAMRLSRTITASVADLYGATQAIDRGDFSHRIHVVRDDQLAELSRSFNRMTGSLQRLLVEQQESERLQNELSIAQEVQANLFPAADINVPGLELHGVCRPARSVSGDYYDFLVFEDDHKQIAGVDIAIGDISGKGISAALLMATLHSAVRAYRFVSSEVGETSEQLFHSPGRVLGLLNHHLYRSTQPEKYATLFLAQYDVPSSRLTYSNAGQLPPLVLCRDRSVRRLDKGGTVVGLMDGMSYEDGAVELNPGEIFIGYSDGVTEPENDFGDFGEERLLETVWRYRDEPLSVISSQVLQALDAWIGGAEQPDDITLVLARRVQDAAAISN